MSEKTDLQEKAATLGLTTNGTMAELRARITEREKAINGVADAAVAGAEKSTPDGPATGLAADAPPAADALEPDPEAARAVYDQFLADRQAKLEEAEADAKVAKAKAERQHIKDAIKTLKRERPPAPPSTDEQGFAEMNAKEGSLAVSDVRSSVFDAAPGKSLDDVLDRNEARAEGRFGDEAENPVQPVQFFIVTDELDLIQVAAKVGLRDHSELASVNGRYSNVLNVQRGQRVILPNRFRFDGVEGVVTEGEETDQLAGSEATA